MKVKGLDNKTYSWSFIGYVPKEEDDKHRSSGHLRARQLLRTLFPLERICEEVPMPGSGGLFCDFIIPFLRIMVEVQGIQHYEQSTFFHKTPFDFINGKKRDANKRKWCEVNNITLIELPDGETENEWRKRIFSATS